MNVCWRCLFQVLSCFAISGCGTARFYSQAVSGQMQILSRARPVERVMQDPKVEGKVKRKLALAADVRRFAADRLGLPAGRMYDRYTDLGRRHVSWVVFAAPEFSVEGETWPYPVVGRLKYRGFFSEAAARAEASDFKARGFDVFVGGVDAYSTLGWFRDPVLNTFLRLCDTEFAELLLHELVHAKIFFPGDTDFNEALATAVSEAGVRLWLESSKDFRGLDEYEGAMAKDREIIRLLLRTRERLDRLYRGAPRQPDDLRRRKAAIFDGMRREHSRIRQRWRTGSHYDRNFYKPWNNARLNTVATYYDLVPGFERLLRNCEGDFASFFRTIDGMRRMSPEQRRAMLENRAPGSARHEPDAIRMSGR